MTESIKIRWLLLKRGLDRSLHRHLGLFLKPAYNAAPKDQSRRNLLKIAGLGLGAAVVGKVAGDKIFSSLGAKEQVREYEGFKVLEKKNKLVFYNRKGNKLFTLSDDGEMEIGD